MTKLSENIEILHVLNIFVVHLILNFGVVHLKRSLSKYHPGLDLDSWKDNARPKCAMKRPYWTHLSYEKTLAGL